MCRNLVQKSGKAVTGYDVDPAKTAALSDVGLTAANDIAEVAAAADMIFICVPGEPQVRELAFQADGLVASVTQGQTVVDMTTATVEVNREVSAALADKGVDFADAPVARGVPAAQDGTLSIMVGASNEVFERIKPFIDCMGTDISHCGDVGTGQVMKLMNNMVVFQNVSAIAEAMAIATRAGVDRQRVFEILSRGSADSFVMRKHGTHMTTGEYPDDQFPTVYSLKDITYALDLAENVGVDAKGAKLVKDRLADAIDRGYGALYCPVIYKLFEE